MNTRFQTPVILAISICVCCASAGAVDTSELNRRMATVDSLISLDQHQDALPILLAFEAGNDLPDELIWPVYQRLGLVFDALGDGDRALEYLEKAAIWGPRVAVNHRNLGTFLMKMGKSGRALSEIREAAELDPDDWRIRLEYAQALGELGQQGAARRELTAAREICPDCAKVHQAWARFHLQQQDYQNAEPHLAALYRLAPTADIRKQLALARLRIGRPDDARVLLLPDWPTGLDQQEIRIVLEADQALGESDRAAELIDLSSDLQTDLNDPDLWALAALVCLEDDRNVVALQMIDMAIGLSPSVVGYHNNRYILLNRLGRDRDASEEWEILLDLDPTRAETIPQGDDQTP